MTGELIKLKSRGFIFVGTLSCFLLATKFCIGTSYGRDGFVEGCAVNVIIINAMTLLTPLTSGGMWHPIQQQTSKQQQQQQQQQSKKRKLHTTKNGCTDAIAHATFGGGGGGGGGYLCMYIHSLESFPLAPKTVSNKYYSKSTPVLCTRK